jgi:competence protein ComEC
MNRNAKTRSNPLPPAQVARLVPVALAAAGGIIADRYGEPWGTSAWVGVALGCAASAVVLTRRRWLGAVVIVVAWGALAGGWHHYRWSDLAPDDLARVVGESPAPAWLRGVLIDTPGYRPGSGPDDAGVTRAVMAVTAVHSLGAWRRASGRVAVSIVGDRSDLVAGAEVEAAGALARVARPLNAGEFDYRNYLQAQGVRLRLVVDEERGVWESVGNDPASLTVPGGFVWSWLRGLGALRAWSHARLTAGLDPSTAPLAAALLLGRREGVDPEVNDAFARTGTTHLLAISGLHLQVLAAALGGFVRLLGFSRRKAFASVAAATVAYALLVGLMPSVVRSAAMTVTYCLAGWLDRRARPANTLALAVLLTLGLNPAYLFDVGCQLSFLAVGAITWGVGPVVARLFPEADPLDALERRFASRWRKLARVSWVSLVQGLTVSTVVWLAALPLVALRFHIVSPIGVILNVPLIPLTSLALLAAGLSLGLSAVWGPLGGPSAWACSRLLGWTDSLVRWGAAQRWGYAFEPGPPWGWVLIFYGLLGLATAAAHGRWAGRKALTVLAVAWVPVGLVLTFCPWLGNSRPGGLEADVLAVGHGLAVVIDAGHGRAILYDCGRMRDPSVGRRVVAPALWERGIRRLEAVVLSHADPCHRYGTPCQQRLLLLGAHRLAA